MEKRHIQGGCYKMAKNKTLPNDETENLSMRLDTIISLLINPKISEDTLTKKIEFLTKMSFSNDDIAKILGTTKGSVESTKYKKPKSKKQ